MAGAAAAFAGSTLAANNPLGDVVGMGVNSVLPLKQPTPDLLIQLLTKRWIDMPAYIKLMKLNGINTTLKGIDKLDFLVDGKPRKVGGWSASLDTDWQQRFQGTNTWDRALILASTKPSLTEIFDLLNRELIDEKLATYYMTQLGWQNPRLIKSMLALREELPPIQDIVRFAVRDVWSPDIVKRFQYQNELPTNLVKWAAQQGLTGKLDFDRPPGIDADGKPLTIERVTWADMYWWAHWELPSLTQGNEMLHRFYAASRYGPSPEVIAYKTLNNADIATDLNDIKLLHKASDYPAFWRDRLIGITYQPLTRVDVRRMRILDVITKDKVYHAYRAIGYTDENAVLLTDFTEEQKRLADLKKAGAVPTSVLCKYYTLGMISPIEYNNRLVDLGLTQPEIDSNIASCELNVKYTIIKEGIGYIKHKYITGDIEKTEAISQLLYMNIQQTRADQYVRLWDLKRKGRHKETTLAQIASWYKAYLITANDLVRRMQNLGYTDPDITIFVRQFNLARTQAENKQMEKAQKDYAKVINAQLKAQQKASKAIFDARKKNLEKVMAASSEANLKAWYAAGLITETDTRARLKNKGWATEDIDRWISIQDQKLAAGG